MPTLQELLQKVLDAYLSARHQTNFGRNAPVYQTFNDAAELVEQHMAKLDRPTLSVRWSVGQGNWARVPWLAILDSRLAPSIQDGIYVVYLFREDMKGFYLTLNQGVTVPHQQLGRQAARERLRDTAGEIRQKLGGLVSQGFRLDHDIDLGTDRGLGQEYIDSTIAHRYYPSGQIPKDEALFEDLDHLVVSYLQLADAAATPSRHWIFQANPEHYDLAAAVRALSEIRFTVTKHVQDVHVHDRVYLWESGPEAGIVAVATVLSEPAQMAIPPDQERAFIREPQAFANNETGVRLRIDRVVEPRLAKQALAAHPELSQLTIITAPQGTNFALTEEEANALAQLLDGKKGEPASAFDRQTASNALLTAIQSSGFTFQPWQLAAYLAAVRTKPFVILAGVSGTGKSQLPQLVAQATGGVCEVIPVRPDWTDSSDVLGYVDLQQQLRPGPLLEIAGRAMENPDRHYVCLVDEMNLARVEHYFAEVLSRMEDRQRSREGTYSSRPLLAPNLADHASKWGQVVLPPNLAVVGTVNMDESAHGFSRKVLDRAFTLEMSEVHLDHWQAATQPAPVTPWPVAAWYPRAARLSELHDLSADDQERVADAVQTLIEANALLAPAQLQVGYRTRDEVAFFLLHAHELGPLFVTRSGQAVDPLDLALQMKLLPRIAGGSGPVRRVLAALLKWANPRRGDSPEDIVQAWQEESRPAHLQGARFPRTAARLCLMWERLMDEGYTSYWL